MTTSTAEPPATAQRSLAHLPVGAFTSVMGIGGLAASASAASATWGLSPWIGRGVGVLGLGVFLLVAVGYGIKAARFRPAVVGEWNHPVQAAFVPTITIALLVLAIAFYSWSPTLSAVLWWPGAVGQAVLTVLIFRTWISNDGIQIGHVHPGWFIPAVGNLVVPIVGVHHAPHAVVSIFFAVGVLYWLGLFAVILVRLFTGGALPPKLLPTLAIFLAPPSLAALSWVALGGAWSDPIATVLLGLVVFQVILLAAQIPTLRKAPFAITAWAYAFPLATATSALLGSTKGGGTDYTWFGCALFVVTAVVVGVVGWKTSVAVSRGKICLP